VPVQLVIEGVVGVGGLEIFPALLLKTLRLSETAFQLEVEMVSSSWWKDGSPSSDDGMEDTRETDGTTS
jgi:hypothetical protein